MLRKPADKLLVPQGHGLRLAAIPVVPVAEAYFIFRDRFNPVVADGHFMCISPKIFYYLFGATEWTLGINHPVLAEQAIAQHLVR